MHTDPFRQDLPSSLVLFSHSLFPTLTGAFLKRARVLISDFSKKRFITTSSIDCPETARRVFL
jgi:hypothetical protein